MFCSFEFEQFQTFNVHCEISDQVINIINSPGLRQVYWSSSIIIIITTTNITIITVINTSHTASWVAGPGLARLLFLIYNTGGSVVVHYYTVTR